MNSSLVNLPSLDLARRNKAASVITACNRVYALYCVDQAKQPFWVMELDCSRGYRAPVGAVLKFDSHIDAVRKLSELALDMLGALEVRR